MAEFSLAQAFSLGYLCEKYFSKPLLGGFCNAFRPIVFVSLVSFQDVRQRISPMCSSCRSMYADTFASSSLRNVRTPYPSCQRNLNRGRISLFTRNEVAPFSWPINSVIRTVGGNRQSRCA